MPLLLLSPKPMACILSRFLYLVSCCTNIFITPLIRFVQQALKSYLFEYIFTPESFYCIQNLSTCNLVTHLKVITSLSSGNLCFCVQFRKFLYVFLRYKPNRLCDNPQTLILHKPFKSSGMDFSV